jgi:plasmid maintenance system antidote protein VapI
MHITSQKILASKVGVTAEYLSYAKRNGMSDTLADKLEEFTGIKKTTWLSPNKKTTLGRQLKEFFRKQKVAERTFN